jgi:hypothetical protein
MMSSWLSQACLTYRATRTTLMTAQTANSGQNKEQTTRDEYWEGGSRSSVITVSRVGYRIMYSADTVPFMYDRRDHVKASVL